MPGAPRFGRPVRESRCESRPLPARPCPWAGRAGPQEIRCHEAGEFRSYFSPNREARQGAQRLRAFSRPLEPGQHIIEQGLGPGARGFDTLERDKRAAVLVFGVQAIVGDLKGDAHLFSHVGQKSQSLVLGSG